MDPKHSFHSPSPPSQDARFPIPSAPLPPYPAQLDPRLRAAVFHPLPPNHLPHPLAAHHHPHHPLHPSAMDPDRFQQSCIPQLLPPGVDPATVDFRTFYPYIPNEVKHRKRTTRYQLKVLEDTFAHDTKPNASTRKRLAEQLDMSPRGVQVWFQNRRAKAKQLAKKAADIGKGSDKTLDGDRSPSDAPASGDSPLGLDTSSDSEPSKPFNLDNKVNSDPDEASTPPSATIPALPTVPRLTYPMEPTAPHAHANGMVSAQLPHPPSHFASDAHLQSLRRGSMPVLSYAHSHPPVFPGPDQEPPSHELMMSRRRSVDASLQRLAAHPYAHLAMAVNGDVYGDARSPRSSLGSQDLSAELPSQSALAMRFADQRRPFLHHRASMPYALHAQHIREARRASLAFGGHSLSPSPEVPSPSGTPGPFISHRTSLLDDRIYPVTSRVIQPLGPGPLPAADFSFGAPEKSGFDSFSFPPREVQEGEEDNSSVSYDALTRFSSIASIAPSDASSMTSACYSDASASCFADTEFPPPNFDPDMRKLSTTSSYFAESFAGMQVNGGEAISPDGRRYSQEALQAGAGAVASTSMEGHKHSSPGAQSGSSGSDGTSYPSPSSTLSAHSNSPPANNDEAATGTASSELALALQAGPQQSASPVQAMAHFHRGSSSSSEGSSEGQYGMSSVYSQPSSSSSSSSLDGNVGGAKFQPPFYGYDFTAPSSVVDARKMASPESVHGMAMYSPQQPHVEGGMFQGFPTYSEGMQLSNGPLTDGMSMGGDSLTNGGYHP